MIGRSLQNTDVAKKAKVIDGQYWILHSLSQLVLRRKYSVKTELVFVDLLWSPRINSQAGVPVNK